MLKITYYNEIFLLSRMVHLLLSHSILASYYYLYIFVKKPICLLSMSQLLSCSKILLTHIFCQGNLVIKIHYLKSISKVYDIQIIKSFLPYIYFFVENNNLFSFTIVTTNRVIFDFWRD